MNPDEAVLVFVDEYSRMAEAYDANIVPRFEPFAARLVERAQPKTHTMVLDVSTGTGLAALLAAKAMGGTGLVVGIDLADGALNLAQTKAARAGLRNLRFEMLDSRNIVYRGSTFDTALCSFGITAIGTDQVLRETHRVLRDGASLHAVNWAPRKEEDGWNALDAVLGKHRTGAPSKTLAELRAAADLVAKIREAVDIRDPNVLTRTLEEVGFSSVRADPDTQAVTFSSVDDFLAFHASYGPVDRELAEMGEEGRARVREDLAAQLADSRDGAVRLRWSVVYYTATK